MIFDFFGCTDHHHDPTAFAVDCEKNYNTCIKPNEAADAACQHTLKDSGLTCDDTKGSAVLVCEQKLNHARLNCEKAKPANKAKCETNAATAKEKCIKRTEPKHEKCMLAADKANNVCLEKQLVKVVHCQTLKKNCELDKAHADKPKT